MWNKTLVWLRHLAHDHGWDHVFHRRDDRRMRRRIDRARESGPTPVPVDPLWEATGLGREAYAGPPAPAAARGCGSILRGAGA